jgi:Heterokaryon incompatibility protein (HET)
MNNYASCLEAISIASLTPLFQDAINFTKLIGMKYIWIDSLCIIQDYLEDWKRESKKMGLIYRRASFNIAAMSFEDGSRGL